MSLLLGEVVLRMVPDPKPPIYRKHSGDSMFEPTGLLAEQRELVQYALAQVSIAQREVLVLKIWQGLTFPQIAEALDIPVNTAASRYRYALTALRRLLAESSPR